ncbi:hypothetical protein OTB20_19345 [Streptomyces sp. H27-H1]|uniref:hypothetical protein n=1 Tax=Streptomyces sp. H27-H1 TaxID=2996461 RepID=UPI002271E3BE|nr:hypothetical protein [Streptomyces sp. H27-H1]MCY0928312.1 hypothetical protein [Streptomyces sp. H27-H1]
MSEPSTEPSATPAPEQPATGSESTAEERLASLEAERDKWQSMSRKQEERAKANAEKARRFDDLEAASKTEAEKLAERAAAAEGKATALVQRAVKAEVRALAAKAFADPSDAAAFLNLGDYVDESGDINEKAIEKDLADLLKRKPHLAKEGNAPSFDGGARTTAAASTDMSSLIRQKAGLG